MVCRPQFSCLIIIGLLAGGAIGEKTYAQPFEDDTELTYEIATEYRYYKNPGDFGQSRQNLSLRFQSEYFLTRNSETETFVFMPFLRIDQRDVERTHYDIREALWTSIGNAWELKAGITCIHWGKTEFLNVVDVINQKDFVEGTKEKLGQPLLGLSLGHEWGNIDAYLLPGFRERHFPGKEGRLRTPILVDDENPVYEHGAGKNNVGFAARWQTQATDALEVALSTFSGLDRDPSFSFNYDFFDPKLIPHYHHKTQYGVELEYIYGGWVGKLEAIRVENPLQDYSAAVAGMEYTFGSIFRSDYDVTLITEYLWDERDRRAPNFFEHDIGLGARISFNDTQSTLVQLGGLFDPQTTEKVAMLEASRRLGENWKVSFIAQSVYERSKTSLSPSVVSALNQFRDTYNIDSSIDIAFVLDWIAREAGRYGTEAVVNLLLNPDSSPNALTSLQQLERLTDAERKLGTIESDDYLQLELTYFY